MPATRADPPSDRTRELLRILLAFLRLGCTSFGGPAAHIGFFRTEFVDRKAWLGDQAFAELVALAQFLPGPASSKLGFAIGVLRGGPVGGLAAWIGFTLPSAALMIGFAWGAQSLAQTSIGEGVLHGLKWVAVAIVAQAVLGMARTLCPDRVTAAIALVAGVLMLLAPTLSWQIGVIIVGALAGVLLCRDAPGGAGHAMLMPVSRRVGGVCLALFGALLVQAFLAKTSGGAALFDAFYRSGALVFGGGHVVLPLLHDAVVTPGWVDPAQFVAGYGAAQALPGPLFAFAAYLGAMATLSPGGVAGSMIALVGIFAPGLLCMLGCLPFWQALRSRRWARAALRGTNAAVVGLLAAVLIDPMGTSTVKVAQDIVVVIAAFMALTVWRLPVWLVVALCVVAGVALVR